MWMSGLPEYYVSGSGKKQNIIILMCASTSFVYYFYSVFFLSVIVFIFDFAGYFFVGKWVDIAKSVGG